jgi:hypothetical protein
MDDSQRLKLQEMVSANGVEDNTSKIRDLKHSVKLKEDIRNLYMLKKIYNNIDELNNQAILECSFLYTCYTDIFNKIKNDEIDSNLLFKFIEILQEIEDGKLDQHEGSFKVGNILKELYVDSAVKKADKINKDREETTVYNESLQINWKQYKSQNKS